MTVICHCTNCQKQGGAAFSVNVIFPKGSLDINGDPRVYKDSGDSGKKVYRHFCAKCGSPIISEGETFSNFTVVKAGTLDDLSWVQPTMAVYCDSAQSWVKLDLELQEFPKGMSA